MFDNLIIEKKGRGEGTKDYVYRLLRMNIIYNRIPPGSNISENALTEIFHVSRTPIREAIIRLVNDELLTVYPQKGTYVSKIKMDRVREATFMREALEKGVCVRACDVFTPDDIFKLENNISQQEFYYGQNKLVEILELDNAFHEIIFTACSMRRVWKAMQGVLSDTNRIRYLKLLAGFRWDETIEEHRLIVTDIRDKRKDKMEIDITNHIGKIYDDVLFLQQEFEDYVIWD